MIVKVRDYGGRVPRAFGHEFREALLEWCVAQAFLGTGKAAVDEQRREATFVLTDPSLDSYGEIIDAGAFDKSLPGYMRNPVVLPEHQHRLPGGPHCAVVGHCQRVFKSGKKLLGTIYFGAWPVGEYRWQPVAAGSLRAVSVGFRPVNTERDKDGVLHYTEAILKEVSTCPIGANDNALLANMFIAGQLELEALKTNDTGKAAELFSVVEDLRAELEALRAEMGLRLDDPEDDPDDDLDLAGAGLGAGDSRILDTVERTSAELQAACRRMGAA